MLYSYYQNIKSVHILNYNHRTEQVCYNMMYCRCVVLFFYLMIYKVLSVYNVHN